MTTEETTTETWLYAGRRLDAKGKTMDAWHDGSKLLFFSKLTGMVPGHAYAVEVVRSDGTARVRGVPRYLGESDRRKPTAKQMDEWRAENAAAKQELESVRFEKRAAEDDELEAALEVLRRHYARARTGTSRGALINYVYGEMTRPPRRRTDADPSA